MNTPPRALGEAKWVLNVVTKTPLRYTVAYWPLTVTEKGNHSPPLGGPLGQLLDSTNLLTPADM